MYVLISYNKENNICIKQWRFQDLTLGGGRGLCQRGGGIIESVDGWSKKSFLACFWHISITIMLKMNRERSERRKQWEKKRFGHDKIIGPRPLGAARAGCAPPWIR